jgi:serine/threonine protein phosphatase PrpC
MLSDGDVIVVATDGLWDKVSPKKVAEYVRRGIGAEGLCQKAARGLLTDDVTVVILRTQQIRKSPSFSERLFNFYRSSSESSIEDLKLVVDL